MAGLKKRKSQKKIENKIIDIQKLRKEYEKLQLGKKRNASK